MLSNIHIQKNIFLIVAFLLGSVASLYGNVFNFMLLALVLFVTITNCHELKNSLKREYLYIIMPILYLVYLVLHMFVFQIIGGPITKPSYSIFEALFLSFILVPIYVLTGRDWLTVKLLHQFVFYFCIGCLLLNVYVVFDLVGTDLFTRPEYAIHFLFNNRLGENKELLGGSMFLEPQALYIALSALFSYFMMFSKPMLKVKVGYGMMFLMFLIFLFFTVTKGTILAFLLSFILLNVYIFRQQTWKSRLIIGLCILVFAGGGVGASYSSEYQKRVRQFKNELSDIRDGNYSGSSIATRVAFWREAFKHREEFQIWGLGVYTKFQVNEWSKTSDVALSKYSNVHNAFLYNWIQGGIVGLAFLLFLFIAPIWRMIRRRRFSYLVLASIVAIFITSNTCVMFSLSNSRSFILFLFAMFYFYSDTFAELENTIRKS